MYRIYRKKIEKPRLPKNTIIKNFWFIIIQYKDTLWLEKKIEVNIWKNLFCFPYFENYNEALTWIKKNSITINKKKKIESFFHIFTHFKLNVNPLIIKISSIQKKIFNINNNGIWYNTSNPQHVGVPVIVKKIYYKLTEINITNKEEILL